MKLFWMSARSNIRPKEIEIDEITKQSNSKGKNYKPILNTSKLVQLSKDETKKK